MRYYKIEITEQDGSPVIGVQGQPIGPFTSLMEFGRTTNLAALNVYLDLPVAAYDSPISTSGLVKIWGLPLAYISQASNLNGKRIVVYGGMSPGLPLADPSQQGILVTATIQQAFGNWQGTNQTLDMYIRPSEGGPLAPRNIIFDWKKDTPMAQAIQNALSTAFKKEGYKVNVNISPNLVAYENMAAPYQSVRQFAENMRQLSRDILTNDLYPGVRIMFSDGEFNVYDVDKAGAIAGNPAEIKFTDYIGQPTWLQFGVITFKTVMRGDIAVGDYVRLPSQSSFYQLTTVGSQSQERTRSAFSGVYQINSVRHLGEFRQRGGDNWVTVFEASPTTSISV